MKTTMKKLFTLVLTIVLILGIAGFSAQAASYPSVFFYSDEAFADLIISDTATLGEIYPIRMYWFAAYNNEGYDISIYDNDGKVVATASKTWTNSGYTKKITVTWNTTGCQPGSYKVVVTKKFYSYLRWNEAPTKDTLRITLQCDHTSIVIDEAVQPTCTQSGLTEGKHCSVCGIVLTPQEVVPAMGHTPVTDTAVPATCTTDGLTEGSHCSVCDAILVAQQVIPATGHTPVTDKGTEATYVKEGKTAGSHCSVCGEVLQEQKVVPKLVAKKVKLNSKKATLNVGKTLQLKATLTPAHKTSKKVKLTWTTSDDKVATVTAKGKVKAVSVGKATITVKTPNGKKATCKVTVKAKKK